MHQNILEVKSVPFKHQRPCSYPGCLELTSERYCSKHITVTGSSWVRFTGSSEQLLTF